jgi:hypothetical protein
MEISEISRSERSPNDDFCYAITTLAPTLHFPGDEFADDVLENMVVQLKEIEEREKRRKNFFYMKHEF